MATNASIGKALSYVVSCSTAAEIVDIAGKQGSDDLLKLHEVYAIRIIGSPISIMEALDPAKLELPHLAATLVLLHNGLDGLARLMSHDADTEEFSCKVKNPDSSCPDVYVLRDGTGVMIQLPDCGILDFAYDVDDDDEYALWTLKSCNFGDWSYMEVGGRDMHNVKALLPMMNVVLLQHIRRLL